MGMVGRIPSGAHEDLAAKKRADLFTDEVFLAHAGRLLIRKMPVRRGGGTDRCFVQDGDLEAIHPVCGRQRLRVICGPPADPDHLIRSAGG